MENNTVKQTNPNFGFQRLRPVIGYCENRNTDSPHKIMAEEYKKFIHNSGPYYLFITITFGRSTGNDARFQFANRFLDRYNQKLFHRNYKKRGEYLKGFAFLENHRSCELADRFHIHFLIKDNDRYRDFDYGQHDEIFKKAAKGVLNGRDKEVFNMKCINLQEVYKDDGAIGYCMKAIWDKNITNIKTVGVDGLSDKEFKNSVIASYLRKC